MENIREVIEMCLEETKIDNLNTFVGFRDMGVVQNPKTFSDCGPRILRFLKSIGFASY
jgi:hypothetical protein